MFIANVQALDDRFPECAGRGAADQGDDADGQRDAAELFWSQQPRSDDENQRCNQNCRAGIQAGPTDVDHHPTRPALRRWARSV